MDSNVSKNTFFHEFLKLKFTNFNYSIKNILKQNLLRAIDLYGQNQNVCIDIDFLSTEISNKIILIESKISAIESYNPLLSSKSKEVTYRSAIAFVLTKYVRSPPKNIARDLIVCLSSLAQKCEPKGCMFMDVCVADSGAIDFHLSSDSVILWLRKISLYNDPSLPIINATKARKIDNSLFSLQYIHSRCCSWLRLGEREKLIVLRSHNFTNFSCCLEEFLAIVWQDRENNLYLSHPAEYRLLRQVFNAIDCWIEGSGNWEKLALNLGEAMLNFEAQCLIFGEVRQKNPEKAIARLGLIALVQLWLKKLLEEKLNISALSEV